MTEIKSQALSILAIFAHPDDETMFLGGSLAFLASKGAEIHYLCATRGEGGEMGDPPVCARDELGTVREHELRCAVEALGGKSVHFLDYQDPVVGPGGELYAFSDQIDSVIRDINQHLSRIGPRFILTHGPGGEYGHPAHIQAHQAVMAALASADFPVEAVYAPSWLSWKTGQYTPKPDLLVDITRWKEQKTAAVQCHRSQHGLFLRNGSARAGRPVVIPEIVRNREALFRMFPEEALIVKDPLGVLLEEIAIPAGEDLS
jgi:LmbE family N-acetylglucosaminyl deacetylase